MNISKKKFKITTTKVYYHSKKNGKIAIRLIGKFLYDFGFSEGDSILVKIENKKIVLLNKVATFHIKPYKV